LTTTKKQSHAPLMVFKIGRLWPKSWVKVKFKLCNEKGTKLYFCKGHQALFWHGLCLCEHLEWDSETSLLFNDKNFLSVPIKFRVDNIKGFTFPRAPFFFNFTHDLDYVFRNRLLEFCRLIRIIKSGKVFYQNFKSWNS